MCVHTGQSEYTDDLHIHKSREGKIETHNIASYECSFNAALVSLQPKPSTTKQLLWLVKQFPDHANQKHVEALKIASFIP